MKKNKIFYIEYTFWEPEREVAESRKKKLLSYVHFVIKSTYTFWVMPFIPPFKEKV